MDPVRVIDNPVPPADPAAVASAHLPVGGGLNPSAMASSAVSAARISAAESMPSTVVPVDMGVIGETPTQRYQTSIQVGKMPVLYSQKYP